MKRAEIWWAELPNPYKVRPVVILTRDEVLPGINGVIVSIVTSTIRNLETEVVIGKQEGLPKTCVINLDNILTVPKIRLKRLIGALSSEKVKLLDDALSYALGIK